MFDPKKLLADAKKDFAAGKNWIDFKNRYIGQAVKGESREIREAFIASPEYKEIREMAEKLEESQPDVTEPSEPIEPEKEYNGAISLRVPKSLHRFLAEEADREGVSLNQLILAKISASLYDQLRGRR